MTVAVVLPSFTTYGLPAVLAAALQAPSVDHVVLIDAGPALDALWRSTVTGLRGWASRIGPLLSRAAGGAILSECWNLAGALARAHADLLDEPAPWVLVLLDQDVIVTVEAIEALVAAVDGPADVAYLAQRSPLRVIETPPPFDGRAFAIGHEAGAGVLLTSHDHLDRRTCAADFLASLPAEADVTPIPVNVL